MLYCCFILDLNTVTTRCGPMLEPLRSLWFCLSGIQGSHSGMDKIWKQQMLAGRKNNQSWKFQFEYGISTEMGNISPRSQRSHRSCLLVHRGLFSRIMFYKHFSPWFSSFPGTQEQSRNGYAAEEVFTWTVFSAGSWWLHKSGWTPDTPPGVLGNFSCVLKFERQRTWRNICSKIIFGTALSGIQRPRLRLFSFWWSSCFLGFTPTPKLGQNCPEHVGRNRPSQVSVRV